MVSFSFAQVTRARGDLFLVLLFPYSYPSTTSLYNIASPILNPNYVFIPASDQYKEKANRLCLIGGYLLRRENLIVNNMQDNNHASRLVARFLVELMGLTQSSP
jgi:hypothetical protein